MEKLSNLMPFLLYISIPGFFGGLVSAFHEYLTSDKALKYDVNKVINEGVKVFLLSSFYRAGCLFFRGLIGAVGAFAIVLLFSFVDGIKTEETNINIIFIISLSMIAGLISFTSLPAIIYKFKNQFLEKEVKELEKMAKEAIEDAENAKEYSELVSDVDTALSRANEADMERAIKRLVEKMSKYPVDRKLNISLARLYKKSGNYSKAIKACDDYLANLEVGKSKIFESHYTVDRADALFNRACYKTLLAKQLDSSGDGNQEEVKCLKFEALQDLRVSIEGFPLNKKYARKDEDFIFIKDDSSFLELIGQ